MTREEGYKFLEEIFFLLKKSNYPFRYEFFYGLSNHFWIDSTKVFIPFNVFNTYFDDSGFGEFWFILYDVNKSAGKYAEHAKEIFNISFYFQVQNQGKQNEHLKLKIKGAGINDTKRQNEILVETADAEHLKSLKYLVYNLLKVNVAVVFSNE